MCNICVNMCIQRNVCLCVNVSVMYNFYCKIGVMFKGLIRLKMSEEVFQKFKFSKPSRHMGTCLSIISKRTKHKIKR